MLGIDDTIVERIAKSQGVIDMSEGLKEALYYKKLDDNKVQCFLCPHGCLLLDEQIGICKVRQNQDGKLYSLNYGNISSICMDPIEKKPLYHFYPGKYVLSVGSIGCNLECSFCQNYEIAHQHHAIQCTRGTSDMLVEISSQQKRNVGIAYTYNEPSIWYEFVLEVAEKIKNAGQRNILVTNGYINQEPLKELIPFVDAMNIDLKSFNKNFYKSICIGSINEVKENIIIANEQCHIEISTLLIEDLNTEHHEIESLAKWLSSINRDIPLHLNRYYPAYKLDLPPTSIKKMKELKSVAEKYLNYVYLGNVHGIDTSTYCPQCKIVIVKRAERTEVVNLQDGRCSKCGEKINIVI